MHISLIITTYNRPDALLLVLKSVECQSRLPYEVIIADDGSSIKTQNLIKEFKAQTDLKIIHSFQYDRGFRAAKSRNKAISKASGEYIILVDGDMVLHHNFINDHEKNSQSGYFVQGPRVLLNIDRTPEILENHNLAFHFSSPGHSLCRYINLLIKFQIQISYDLDLDKNLNPNLIQIQI